MCCVMNVLPTPRNTLLHLSTITNLFVLFALLWPALSLPHSTQHQLWFPFIPLLCSCHLELNSSWNPLIATHWRLHTQPKNSLLLLTSCLGHLLPVHQIQFILTISFYIFIYIYKSTSAPLFRGVVFIGALSEPELVIRSPRPIADSKDNAVGPRGKVFWKTRNFKNPWGRGHFLGGGIFTAGAPTP